MEQQNQNQQPAQNGQANGQQTPMPAANVPAMAQPSYSERFTKAIEREFASNNGQVVLTSFQKKLCQNYFIKIDMILKEGERKRMAKNEQYRDQLPMIWDNVNLYKLAVDVITFSAVGLDPVQPNHINPIPFKNNGLNKYDITFIIGYRGVELKAKKYGLDLPDEVTVELVYQKDVFKPIKKDINNKVESYSFDVSTDLDRGEIVGGFYYHSFKDNPEKNRLRTFSRKDIEKRKPSHASAEFWGGEKAVYNNGQRSGTETVEGWFDEMAYKTIYRAAYNAITIDSEKIDEHYLAVIEREKDNRDFSVHNEIANNANQTEVGFDDDMSQPANGTAPVVHQLENNATVPMPNIQAQAPQQQMFQPQQAQAPQQSTSQAPW